EVLRGGAGPPAGDPGAAVPGVERPAPAALSALRAPAGGEERPLRALRAQVGHPAAPDGVHAPHGEALLPPGGLHRRADGGAARPAVPPEADDRRRPHPARGRWTTEALLRGLPHAGAAGAGAGGGRRADDP